MVSGFQVFIDSVFNPVFGWLLNIPPILAILFLALVLGLISTLLQKYLTDQAKMKRLKDDTKKYQEQMKKLRGEPEKLMKVQQKVIPIQMELMKESFKPLLVSLIPFLLIFFWLSNHFAYHQIQPNTPFVVSTTFESGITGNATLRDAEGKLTIEQPTQSVKEGMIKWVVKGPAGEHTLNVDFAGATITRTVLITTDRAYEQPLMPFRGTITGINVENEKLTPIPGFSLFGWHPGWIFYYIILSIPLSLLLKKWLQVV